MKQQPFELRKQSGIALIALLALLVLAGGYAFYRSTNMGTERVQEAGKLRLQLARAKEALIAYAVVDAKRPGRLLCPDLIGNGISPILTRDDCDSANNWQTGDIYAGWLPGKTLDLNESADSYGSNFRYYVSPLFGGDRKTPPLNSDTPTRLHLDVPAGGASNDIAALIIATRGPLDTRNADGDDYFYNGTSDSPDDNDVIIAITRQELMAAVEQRIANEIRSCLEQHATHSSNTEHSYPWPAPLANNIFTGTTGSLFGMIPATQAGNPEEALKASNIELSRLKISLESASTASGQLAALQEISAIAAGARSLYDRLYIAAADLQNKAKITEDNFRTLDAKIVAATTDSTAFGVGAETLPATIADRLPSLATLGESLANLGLDVFLMEMQAQTSLLRAKTNSAAATPSSQKFSALQAQNNVFKNKIFEYSSTPNPSISALLAAGLVVATQAAGDALLAKNQADNSALIAQAIDSANALTSASSGLIATVQNNRVSVLGIEFNIRADQILLVLGDSSLSPELKQPALRSMMETSRNQVAAVSTGSSTVLTKRSAALLTLDAALAATQPSSDLTLIGAASLEAINRLNELAAALSNNGDNVAQESLKLAMNSLAVSSLNAPTTITAGTGLRPPVKVVIYWADTVGGHAADVARLARKSVSAANDSTSSAYTTAGKMLASLDGETGAIYLVDKFIKDNNQANQQAAEIALAKTQGALNTLLDKASSLDNLLESSLALGAVPTVWYGTACTLLKPPTGSDAWWTANGWSNFFFYQISDRIRTVSGKLTVNGGGAKRQVVVIGSGRALIPQNRTTRTTSEFLEGINADNSRDGNATQPAISFTTKPLSSQFNDRLAY